MQPARAGRGDPDRPLDLVVVGHLNLDHIVEVRSLPSRDRTVPALRRRTVLGGTGANLALAAARWGVRTALVTRVGADYPREFDDELRRAGIDLRGVEHVEGTTSSACIILHDTSGNQMTIIDQGPMGEARRAPVPDSVLHDAAWVHLGTGDPPYLRRVEQMARRLGLRVAIDPAQEIHYRWSAAQLRPYLGDAEILFGNEHEIAAAARLLFRSSPRALVDLVPLVVVTRGARGARAYFRGGSAEVPALRLGRAVDPTGAGDAFRGGFYAGWFAGQPLRTCLKAGNRAAAEWMRGRGPPRGRSGTTG